MIQSNAKTALTLTLSQQGEGTAERLSKQPLGHSQKTPDLLHVRREHDVEHADVIFLVELLRDGFVLFVVIAVGRTTE